MTELALRSFLTLFVVVDPVGIAPAFLALVGERPRAEQKRVARKAVAVAGAVLFGFALGGDFVLGHLVGQAKGEAGRLAAVFAMTALVLGLTWLALRLSGQLARVLRRTGVNVVTRVLGVLLAALAVQYVADGVRGLLRAG